MRLGYTEEEMKKSWKTFLLKIRTEAASRVLLGIFLALLVLNILVPPTSDDLGYSINSGLLDIFHREYIQYMTWTGRSVAHILARCFLSLPKGIFDVCNALVFTRLIVLIHYLAAGRKLQPKILVVTALLVFLTAPVFGQTVLWETGSCNYLWTTTIILEFLQRWQADGEAGTVRRAAPLVMFLWGIVSGWTNENTGGALILMELFFLRRFRREKKSRPWMAAALAGSVLGFVILLAAPGNQVRAQDFVDTRGTAYILTHDLINTLRVYDQVPGQLVLWILFAILMAVSTCPARQKKTALAFALCGAAAVAAIVLSPVSVLYDRSMFGATIFLVTGIVCLLPGLEGKTVFRAGLAVLILFTCWQYANAVLDLAYIRYQWNKREAWVQEQAAAGNLNPAVPELNTEFLTTYNPLNGLVDLIENPEFVNNVSYAQTHSLQSVTVTTEEHWSRVVQNGDPELMNCRGMADWLDTAQAKGYEILAVSTGAEDRSQEEQELLEEALGVDCGTGYFVLACQEGSVQLETGENPVCLELNLGSHYVYLSSSADAGLADITVDNEEISRDQAGITVAAYDPQTDRFVDEITWNQDSGTSYGIR